MIQLLLSESASIAPFPQLSLLPISAAWPSLSGVAEREEACAETLLSGRMNE